jgi:hypothetical protein
VVVVTTATGGAELEVARAELEAARLDGQLTDLGALPLRGEMAALAAARQAAEAGLAEARADFLATRYAAALARVRRAEEQTAAWAGDPRTARALAQAELVAAQCGDREAWARAAAHAPRLELDPAAFSPDVRSAFQAARAARARAPQGTLLVGTEPTGASVFVDGELVGRTPLSTPVAAGPHMLLVMGDGRLPVSSAATIPAGSSATVALELSPLTGEEELGALRLLVETGAEPGAQALAGAARRLDADAVVVVRPSGAQAVHAVVAGPVIGWAAFEQRGDGGGRLAALRRALADVGRHVRGECSFEHLPPERGRAGSALTLGTRSGQCVAHVRGAWRAGGRIWSPLRSDQPLLLPSSPRPFVLEYWLLAESARGSLVGEAGSERAPLRVPIEPDRPARTKSWYRNWWVWAIVGAGIAAGATTLYLLTAPGTDARL